MGMGIGMGQICRTKWYTIFWGVRIHVMDHLGRQFIFRGAGDWTVGATRGTGDDLNHIGAHWLLKVYF